MARSDLPAIGRILSAAILAVALLAAEAPSVTAVAGERVTGKRFGLKNFEQLVQRLCSWVQRLDINDGKSFNPKLVTVAPDGDKKIIEIPRELQREPDPPKGKEEKDDSEQACYANKMTIASAVVQFINQNPRTDATLGALVKYGMLSSIPNCPDKKNPGKYSVAVSKPKGTSNIDVNVKVTATTATTRSTLKSGNSANENVTIDKDQDLGKYNIRVSCSRHGRAVLREYSTAEKTQQCEGNRGRIREGVARWYQEHIVTANQQPYVNELVSQGYITSKDASCPYSGNYNIRITASKDGGTPSISVRCERCSQ